LEGELIDDEKLVAEQRMATSTLIDKLEELKVKLVSKKKKNVYLVVAYSMN
jgi:hypothetical protein